MNLPGPDAPPEELVRRLAETLRANYLRFDEPDQHLSEEEARRLAEEVLRQLLPRHRFPRLSDRRGFMFAVEEGAGSGGRDVLHVMIWYGDRWMDVDAIELPSPS